MKPFPKIPGVELVLAGGYVRDHLLGLEPDDRDFVMITNLTLEQVAEGIKRIGGKVFTIKPEFLTIKCIIDNEVIDLVMPRSEGAYTDGRHPDNVKQVETLFEDSSRRDFTINSMYMDESGDIIDHHGGKEDLDNGIIRCVGDDASERFKEDYLRILRGLRFSIKYGFEFEEMTEMAMHIFSMGLINVSQERIRTEINKMLKLNPIRTFKYIKDFRIMSVLLEKGLWFQLTGKKKR